jgi:hypothetical protein
MSRRMCRLLIVVLCTVGRLLLAQDPGTTNVSGNTDVYSSSSGTQGHSAAYIDASVFYYYDINVLTQFNDICQIINQILKGTALSGVSYPTAGAVIDARGILPIPNPLPCSVNPFSGVTNAKATILLPAATIGIQVPWILPSNTKIIGEGKNETLIAPLGSTLGGFQPDNTNALIEMGSANPSTGVVIEHLTIQGPDTDSSATPYTAIINNYAQDASYVNDVAFYKVGATTDSGLPVTACSVPAVSGTSVPITTGLCVGPSAVYSGPYTDLDFNGAALCTSSCKAKVNGMVQNVPCTCQPTACVQIQAQTRGLRGLTCTAASASGLSPAPARAAVYIDSYNNTVEDVHVEGFYDAIVVGDNPANGPNGTIATGNTIRNITSAFGSNTGPTWHTVHICNPASSSQDTNSACQNITGTVTVGDTTIYQAQSTGPNVPGPPAFPAGTIVDDLTQTAVNSSASPAFVAMYSVGELAAPNNAYSRFTTAPGPNIGAAGGGIPNWGVGNVPLGTGSTSCSNPGAIYSNTSGISGTTLFVCSGVFWKPIG